MSEPVSPQMSPYPVECDEGKTYWWCSCGQSKNQPYCDGSHKGSDFVPKSFAADKPKVFLCGCKLTKNPPFCDGSHNA